MTDISVLELAELTAGPQPIVVLDVREQDEYDDAHLPGVLHIPISVLMERMGEVPVGEPVYVICAVGGRSAQVVDYLDRSGSEIDAINVAGGTVAWQQAGLPTESGVDNA
ncbi:rhodanese-like domain-containing protein [Cryobacterium melibiosiphilum]|uniref:Rhodanese-like domain-containing protein n=1 Tax=Cryobacterium melibiosiphilum TaxID=995039 RepID=A0A3A5MB06_9MICO|nr:rhodanese-like domain-containing protein [Cryobacterium melibiosiphilum]RJT85268.1 rhodanese-like domain-containing protein [Cryobacterium melibiosiphilum]